MRAAFSASVGHDFRSRGKRGAQTENSHPLAREYSALRAEPFCRVCLSIKGE